MTISDSKDEAMQLSMAPIAGPDLAHGVSLGDHRYLIRPALPLDEIALIDMFTRSSPEDIRLRCLGVIKNFAATAAARLAHCDGEQELALIAIDVEAPAREIVGAVHLVRDPAVPAEAEYDVLVRTDMKGKGVGYQLMTDALALARERGLERIVGYISSENHAMLQMVGELGFTLGPVEAGVQRVVADISRRSCVQPLLTAE